MHFDRDLQIASGANPGMLCAPAAPSDPDCRTSLGTADSKKKMAGVIIMTTGSNFGAAAQNGHIPERDGGHGSSSTVHSALWPLPNYRADWSSGSSRTTKEDSINLGGIWCLCLVLSVVRFSSALGQW
jgi:hypothetical protein